MLDLESAIKHCDEVAEAKEKEGSLNQKSFMPLNDFMKYRVECLECASEHRQLAKWLRELQNYQTAREEINQEIINWNDIDNGKVRGLFLAESIIAHYVEGVNADE